MKGFDKIFNKIPISLNLLTVIISLLLFYQVIDIPFDNDKTIHDDFSYKYYEIINTLFSLTLLMLCRRLKLCAYNWVASFNLLFMNVVNLLALFFGIGETIYYFMFVNGIFAFLTMLSIILYIKEFNPKTKINDTRRNTRTDN